MLCPDLDREEIQAELNRILGHPLFANSRRYPTLLRHVVDQALSGSSEGIKERTLGVEVFGREPHYDTNADPIVRTTAVEIRKRLQQYYSSEGRGSTIQIQLPAGSYVPEFVSAAPAVGEAPSEPEPKVPERFARKWWRAAAMAAGILVGGALLVAWARPWLLPTASENFWRPLMASRRPILICIGGKNAEELPGRTAQILPLVTPATTAEDMQQTDMVAFADATALSRVAGVLQTKSKTFEVRGEMATTFADLRESPAVLIGAFNNAWSLRLSRHLRFSYESTATPDGRMEAGRIVDRENPNASEWVNTPLMPFTGLRQDYALISRVFDPETRQWFVMIGGILKWGTLSASEFLSDPRYLESLARQAPAGWQKKNLQVVIVSRIYGGTPGPPQVLATHFW